LDGSSPSILMVERRVSMKLRKEKRGHLLTQTGLEDTDVVSQLEGPEQQLSAQSFVTSCQKAWACFPRMWRWWWQ